MGIVFRVNFGKVDYINIFKVTRKSGNFASSGQYALFGVPNLWNILKIASIYESALNRTCPLLQSS